jgi:hypothetical protein
LAGWLVEEDTKCACEPNSCTFCSYLLKSPLQLHRDQSTIEVILFLEIHEKLGVMVHAYNSSNGEAEAGELRLRLAWTTQQDSVSKKYSNKKINIFFPQVQIKS